MADIEQLEATDHRKAEGRGSEAGTGPTSGDPRPTTIKFGTDGWRATIAEEYTYANVRTLAAALAEYLKKNEKEKAPNGV